MSEERYVPTEQDLRSNAVYPASRLVEEQLKQGVHFPDPAAQVITYAETFYQYVKTGETK